MQLPKIRNDDRSVLLMAPINTLLSNAIVLLLTLAYLADAVEEGGDSDSCQANDEESPVVEETAAVKSLDTDNDDANGALMEQFVRWFEDNGGILHPLLQLGQQEGLGFGLQLDPKKAFLPSTTITYNDALEPVVIPQGQILLQVPFSLHITPSLARTTLNQESSSSSSAAAAARGRVKNKQGRDLFAKLSDHAVLALFLLTRTCRAESATTTNFHTPYIRVLMRHANPPESASNNNTMTPPPPPVLASFDKDELKLLDDAQLHSLFQHEEKSRQFEWTMVIAPWLRKRQRKYGRPQTQQDAAATTFRPGCMTPKAYSEAFGVVTSHASSILPPDDGAGDNKRSIALIPMADMINHATRSKPNDDDKSFDDHHKTTVKLKRIDDYSPTSAAEAAAMRERIYIYNVLADRDVIRNRNKDDDSITMIWEEYSKLDNSIFLLHFGFCPVDNPNHCVMLSPKKNGANGNPTKTTAEPVCVNRLGHIVDVDDNNDQKDGQEQQSRDAEILSIREAAQKRLKYQSNSLDENVKRLEEIKAARDGRIQSQIALQCRIEDQKVLTELSKLKV